MSRSGALHEGLHEQRATEIDRKRETYKHMKHGEQLRRGRMRRRWQKQSERNRNRKVETEDSYVKERNRKGTDDKGERRMARRREEERKGNREEEGLEKWKKGRRNARMKGRKKQRR